MRAGIARVPTNQSEEASLNAQGIQKGQVFVTVLR